MMFLPVIPSISQGGKKENPVFVKIEQISDIGTAPRVYSLIRISYNKKIVMKLAQNLHQFILNKIYVLKFIYHYVFKTGLPF